MPCDRCTSGVGREPPAPELELELEDEVTLLLVDDAAVAPPAPLEEAPAPSAVTIEPQPADARRNRPRGRQRGLVDMDWTMPLKRLRRALFSAYSAGSTSLSVLNHGSIVALC
jgi:hypothetical protein